MRRVYIVVEGQTEQEFVNTVISPYLPLIPQHYYKYNFLST